MINIKKLLNQSLLALAQIILVLIMPLLKVFTILKLDWFITLIPLCLVIGFWIAAFLFCIIYYKQSMYDYKEDTRQ